LLDWCWTQVDLLMLRGASMHHVVLLDDSLSMRDQESDSTVFHQALQILENMLVEGSRQPGTSRITLLSTTDPERPIIADRTLDAAFVQEILPRLRNLSCSWRASSPVDAINAARDILAADGGAAPHVHFLTDLRATDWNRRPDTVAALESLKTLKASVDLVAVVNESRSNVVIQQLAAETLAVAQGVPWRMTVTLKNYSSAKAIGLRGTVLLDGASLPGRILIPDIEPGAELQVSHDVTFDSEGRHQIEVRLDDDALREDNRRFLAVEVTEKRLILIIDDEGQQEDASFVAAAVSADPALTGLASEVRASQTLTSANLSRYDCIYLLNVRDLPADTTLLLTDYVRNGGGIVWFPGEQANVRWYSETLRDPSMKLFPVPIGTVHEVDPGVGAAKTDVSPFLTPVFEEHPIFMIYNAPDSPFPDTVQIARWLQVTDDWNVDDTERADGVRTIMRLRTGQPVVFEHAVGRGRVLTFLVGAGRRWSNWPVAPASPGYVVMNLLMHQYLQRPVDSVESRELLEPIRLQWLISQFTENVEVYLPEAGPNDEPVAETFVRLQATLLKNDSNVPGETPSAKGEDRLKENTASSAEQKLGVVIKQAERPGIYRFRRFSPDGNVNDLVMALNVPTSESSLALADQEQITSQSELDHVRILESDAANSLGGSQAGRELRWLLLGLLIATLVAEQLLALRLSYHPV
jgi:hypothetical protein